MKTGWKIAFSIIIAMIVSLSLTYVVLYHNGTCDMCGCNDAMVNMSSIKLGHGMHLTACQNCSWEVFRERIPDKLNK